MVSFRGGKVTLKKVKVNRIGRRKPYELVAEVPYVRGEEGNFHQLGHMEGSYIIKGKVPPKDFLLSSRCLEHPEVHLYLCLSLSSIQHLSNAC